MSTEKKPEYLKNLLESLHERAPWPVMSSLLKKNELLVSRGARNTIKKLLDEYNFAKEEKANELNQKIESLFEDYCEHLLTGEKQVKIFSINSNIEEQILKDLSTVTVKENEFLKSYPLPLSQEKLEEMDSSTYLVDVKYNRKVMTFVFCTSRFSTSRVKFKPQELDSDLSEMLSEYDELVGIKRNSRQFFDVVTIRKGRGLIEFRMDISGGLPVEERPGAFVHTRRCFQRLFSDRSLASCFSQELNVFPLLQHLYSDKEEGKVVEIGFVTGTASIKHERMRRGQIDLRDEVYHKAGMDAVQRIDLYRLAVHWHINIQPDLSSYPELLIPGHVTLLNSENEKYIDGFEIRKYLGLEDYESIIKKVIKYLKNND